MESSTNQKPLVIVTGGSGLIGHHLTQRLVDRYTVVVLDIKKLDPPIEGADWQECDFTNDESVSKVLSQIRDQYGSNLASVIHLAAYYDFSGDPSPLYDELTVQGTRRLLEGLKRFDTVEQFAFSSSLLVMKPCSVGEKLTEHSATQAEWEYPQSKLEAEATIQKHHGEIPTVILRLAGLYDEQGHSPPITQNIRRIAEKEMESYLYPGDAERGQAFIHLDDAVESIVCTIEKREELPPWEIFLIAEDECLSYEKLQDLIGEEIHGVDDWPTIRIPKVMAKAGAWVKDKMASSEEDEPFIKPWMVDIADAHYPVDNSHAKQRLGWQPKHRLSETLPTMVHHLKENPEQWYKLNKLPLPDNKQTLEEIAQ